MLGRRGPAQAAFTTPEIKELGEMEEADVYVPAEEAELDPLSRAHLEQHGDRMEAKKVEIIQSYAGRASRGYPKRLVLRFLVSPLEILGDENGRVRGIRVAKNELYEDGRGGLRPRPTGETEELPVELVFRSVGYTGVALPGVPFNNEWGVILNEKGRILDETTREPIAGLYAAGWIKRGATGVIGTNKPDAAETVDLMIEDAAAGQHFEPDLPGTDRAEAFIASRQPSYFSYADWRKLDELETCNGEECGRPRVKFTCVEDMLEALGKTVVQ
jgi:ferredoxin--NADP+ reductase